MHEFTIVPARSDQFRMAQSGAKHAHGAGFGVLEQEKFRVVLADAERGAFSRIVAHSYRFSQRAQCLFETRLIENQSDDRPIMLACDARDGLLTSSISITF
jgi:hypothetical protein